MGGRFLKGENLFYKKLKFNHIKFKTDKSCFLSVSSDFFCLIFKFVIIFSHIFISIFISDKPHH